MAHNRGMIFTRKELKSFWKTCEVSKNDCKETPEGWTVFGDRMDKGCFKLVNGILFISNDGTSDFPEVISDAMSGGFSRLIFPWLWRTLKEHWSFRRHGLAMLKDLKKKVDWSQVAVIIICAHSRGVDLSIPMARKLKKDFPVKLIGFGGAVYWTNRGRKMLAKEGGLGFDYHRVYSEADPVPKINVGGDKFKFYHCSTTDYVFENAEGVFDHTNYDEVLDGDYKVIEYQPFSDQ